VTHRATLHQLQTLLPVSVSEQYGATWDPYGFHRVATGSYFSPVRFFASYPRSPISKFFSAKKSLSQDRHKCTRRTGTKTPTTNTHSICSSIPQNQIHPSTGTKHTSSFKWKITEEWRVPQILVRFTHYKSVIEVVTVHYTARSAEGHYQPWSAWDGCTLEGDPPDHGRKIWRMVRSNNYYPITAGTIGPGMTTRYKDQRKKYDHISEFHGTA